MSKYRDDFFKVKRPWSIYKDAVLDYYLKPYLQKVKKLGRPVVVVDMFAGRGEFESGEPGSPLIVARRLEPLAKAGHSVGLLCYEEHGPFVDHLRGVLAPFPWARCEQGDCFAKIDEIATMARTNTVFLYVDPCKPTRVHFDSLARVYERLRQNSSVEVLLVLMAGAFMRQAAWTLKQQADLDELGVLNDPLVRDAQSEEERAMWADATYGAGDAVRQAETSSKELNAIAGGAYWRNIALAQNADWPSKCNSFVVEYKELLRKWFKLVESYPIRADTGSDLPKYWMVFGSRYPPALDFFNRAACFAAREQRQNYRAPDTLFAETPKQPEKAPPSQVDEAVLRVAKPGERDSWDQLRWRTCGDENIGRFTDSEIDQSIKRLLKSGRLQGPSGDTIEGKVTITRPRI